MSDLGELFGVLHHMGLERRPSPPVTRVPERPATIYVDVQSCWAKPSWTRMAFLFGVWHSYPRTQMWVVAGAHVVNAPPSFDGWIAYAKSAPLELLAERRSDGAGVVIWREPPTRASVFARLAQLNETLAAAPAPGR